MRTVNSKLFFILAIIFFTQKNFAQDIPILDKVGVENKKNEEKLYRPNFHFTPEKNWMNDPNGMFYYKGQYHLYFQHNPEESVWGPMYWGHAVSDDMVVWKEQPIALHPDELGTIYSGSAIVDENNTSGFGKTSFEVPIVAIYTNHKIVDGKKRQIQSIAYSTDEGKTFTKYKNNPVLIDDSIINFRDPKVFWNKEKLRWVMVIAAEHKIKFYESKDLKKWDFLSDFGKGIGEGGAVWECPDFFELPVLGTDETKWVLFVSLKDGPNGGTATQYFIGDFDGKQFTLDKKFENSQQKNHSYWIDFGKDNYAGVSWSNIRTEDNSKLVMGWMSNWEYAQVVPTETWRSAMTIARKVQLQKNSDGYRLLSNPVKELEKYREEKSKLENIEVNKERKIIDGDIVDLSSADIVFNISDIKDSGSVFKLSNDLGEKLLFGYNQADNTFFIDRRLSGKTSFSKKFATNTSTAPRTSSAKNITGRILLDKTSIEVFFDNGETVMTEIFFPNSPYTKLSVEPLKNQFTLNNITIYQLNFN